MGKIIVFLILMTFLIGEVKGIIKLVSCDFKAPYKAEVLYAIGIPTGLNSFFGWIDLGK